MAMTYGAPTVGLEDTYGAADRGEIIVRQLDDELQMYMPNDYPMLNLIGMASLGFEPRNPKVEWMEEKIFPTTDTLAVAIAGAADVSCTVGHGEYFHIGDIAQIENELVWVHGIDGDVLYIERGFGGTTAAAHAINSTVYIMANARLEGSSPGIARQTAIGIDYNYCQIIDETVSATGTQLETQYHGQPLGMALLRKRLDQRLQEMNAKLDRALFNNRRAVGSKTSPRAFGGLIQFVTDVDDLSAAPLQVSHIETAIVNILSRVNESQMPTTIVSNIWFYRKLQAWWTWEKAQLLGGLVVRRVLTPWGQLDYLYDRNLTAAEAWLYKPGLMTFGPYAGRGLKETDCSLSGEDAVRHRILGEYVAVVHAADAMVKIFNYSTTA